MARIHRVGKLHGKRERKSSGDLQGLPHKSSAEYLSAHVYEETT